MQRAIAVVFAVGFTVSCAAPEVPERVPVDTGTFGNTVITLACKRIAYLESVAAFERGERATIDVAGDEYRDVCRDPLIAPPAAAPLTLLALHATRPSLISAVDATFPESFLEDLQTFLTSTDFLALYDDGTAIDAIDALIETLEIFSDDAQLSQPFVDALQRLNHRLGYLPITPSLGTARLVVNYPGLHDFLLSVTEAVTGNAKPEFDALLAALSISMRHAEVAADADAPDRTAALARDLLFSSNPLLGTSRQLPLVWRDARGLARVALDGGSVPAPFVDLDDDGLADADDLGRFVDAAGTPLAVVPAPFELPAGEEPMTWPRDEQGRALTEEGGAPLYEYVDLDKTLLAALTRDALRLFDPEYGTAFDMLRGASLLVGPRVMTSRTYDSESIEYRGYDTERSALLDVVYGYLVLLTDPQIYDTLELARQLLTNHDAEASRLFEAMIDTARKADLFPGAELEPGSPLFDDMMPVIHDILQTPGLAEDLLRAMESPEIAELGLRFAEQMKYKDVIGVDANTHELIGTFATPVDRSQPDSGNNRSVFQRLAHIIHDSNGVQMCNKQGAVVRDPFIGFVIKTYDECDLLQIDDLAAFYVQSIAYAKNSSGAVIYDNGVPRPKARFPFTFNNALISSIVDDDLLESETGIEGFRFHPTPQALNRVLFLDPLPEFLLDSMDPARCSDGDRFRDAHPGTLLAWELNGFYDQVRPIVQAFADHDAEHLFIELLSVVHQHYPSRDSLDHQQTNPANKGYAYASNMASYEPLFVDVLEERLLMNALSYNAPVLNSMNINGRSSVDVMASAARFILLPRSGLANRYGETSTTTEDGRPVPVLSPWYIMAEANQAKRAMLDSAATEGAAWRSSVANTVDVLLRADAVVGVGWQFRNPRFRGITVGVVDFLDSRLRAHDTAGDRTEWLTDDLPARLEDVLTTPVFAGAADFILSLQTADPEARRELEGLLAYLVDEVASTDVFWTSLSAAADILQLVLDDRDIVAIARAVGEVVHPDRAIVQRQLEFARRARLSDEGQALSSILRNLFEEHRTGHTAVGDLIDGITEVSRQNPYDDLGEPYRADDYRAAFRAVASFLGEEKRGLRKFIQIIQSRNP